MSRRGSYGPMSDRVHPRQSGADDTPPDIKHCWVTTRHGRLPALLLEWHNIDGEWRGRVVHPDRDDHGWVVVEEWMPAGLLDPLELR